MDRRDFLQNAATATTLGFGTRHLTRSEINHGPLALPKGLRILFQGDSITDAGRDRGDYYANSGRGMGGGYVYQIVAELLAQNAEAEIECFNRGISGHKVYQLADRWDLDCLALRPDVLSILIGVNDYWHMLNGNYAGTVEIYEHDFHQLLTETKSRLPNLKLIICEPFAVTGGTAINEKWADFDQYRTVAANLAMEFKAAFVPFHSIFSDALRLAPASYWCPDGVHPSIAGAQLMKTAWLDTFSKIMK
jgi:lysophospholipase L1-like esterase